MKGSGVCFSSESSTGCCMALEKASVERLSRRPFLERCSKEMMKGGGPLGGRGEHQHRACLVLLRVLFNQVVVLI